LPTRRPLHVAKELDIDKMLQDAEKGKTPSSMGKVPGYMKGLTKPMPSPQPKQEPMPAPKSNAPAGAGFKRLPSNIGLMVQKEAMKVFAGNPIKRAGKPIDPAAALPYRKPAIEGGEGPHAV
jgi:hypothetical protein